MEMNLLVRVQSVFSKEERNTQRQEEFDYLKGIFMVFIFGIHAFQATLTEPDLCMKILYGFATMTGAALFMFVMGIGTVYSRNANAGIMLKNGVKMIAYQYLNNGLYLIALTIPYPFVKNMLSEEEAEMFHFLIEIYVQYINIFFMTGVIYLLLALFKKLKMPVIGYAMIGFISAFVAPLIAGTPVDIPVLGYIFKLLIGFDLFTSFIPLYFISYVLIGVAFGKLLRHVKDKEVFYKSVTGISGICVAGTWISLFIEYGFSMELYDFLTMTYSEPGFLHVIASVAHILFFAGMFYLGRNYLRKENIICRQILYYSKHISKYYAIHIVPYFIALGFHKYSSFTAWQCWILALLSMVFTEVVVRSYIKLHTKFADYVKNLRIM